MKGLLLALGLLSGTVAGAQGIVGAPAPPSNKGHVTFAADVTEVPAGKPTVIELRFRVDPGFHVNSHTPSSDLLIPTKLKLDAATGVTVAEPEYPKGMAFHLGPETLDVYQGEFRVKVKVVVPKGQSTLVGGLRYQA